MAVTLTTPGASGDNRRRTSLAPPGNARVLLVFSVAILALLTVPSLGATIGRGAPANSPLVFTITIKVVRTGAATASVLGTSDALSLPIDVLVGGTTAKSGITMYNGDYWFLDVPVSDGASVQTRIVASVSPLASLPAFVPQPVGPPGFIYAKGADLMRDGQPIQLSGVDEEGAFLYGMIASGLWGAPNPGGFWGNNQLFPSGPDTKVPNVTDAESLWREFFRYFLHYNQVAGAAGYPKVNLIRIMIVADSWNPEGTYYAWKNQPAVFFDLFDRMVYWAKRAGIYLVPVLGHLTDPKDNRFLTLTDVRYAHHIEFVRALMDRYDNESQIAMWDVWNEPDVNDDVYWASVGGIVGFRTWASTYLADVKPHSAHHLLTLGMGGWDLFPGIPGYGWQYYFFFNDIPGLEVSHHHTYGTAQDQYLIDWETDWHKALGKPHYEGEFGYNLYPGPSPMGYGYWPWYAARTQTAGWPAISTMVYVDNGHGPFTDYPYLGALPNYPSGFDFSLSLNPNAATVSPGQSAVTTVTTSLTIGPAQAVAFSASGLPSGASASFSVATCSPACTSTLNISTTSATPAGTYTITVTAMGGGSTHTATYTLTVTVPGVPCPSAPPSFPNGSWDRVWCDSGFTAKLGDLPDEPSEMFDNNWLRGTIAGIRADDIGFRSGRTLSLPAAGSYTFTVGGDDGIRLWIDGTLLLDHWIIQAYTTYNVTTTLSAGSHIARLDYFDNLFDARVSFRYAQDVILDRTPPATVIGLMAVSPGTQNVTLRWTAPGDDGGWGQATSYDLRYSSSGPITGGNFYAGNRYATAPPKPSGSAEEAKVVGLLVGVTYWFDLRTADEVPNWSGVSNSPSATMADAIPPATISDLRVAAVGRTYVTLAWTAPGDDGRSGQATSYDLRFSTSGPITDSNFGAALNYGIHVPSTPGTTERATVSGLRSGTRYWFAIRASDEVPNWAGVSDSPSAVTFRWRWRIGGMVAPLASCAAEGETPGLQDLLCAPIAVSFLVLAGAGCLAVGAARGNGRSAARKTTVHGKGRRPENR